MPSPTPTARTPYLLIAVARFVSEIHAERVVCLTATATPHVAQDICDAFGVDKSGLFKTTVYRPKYIFFHYPVLESSWSKFS